MKRILCAASVLVLIAACGGKQYTDAEKLPQTTIRAYSRLGQFPQAVAGVPFVFHIEMRHYVPGIIEIRLEDERGQFYEKTHMTAITPEEVSEGTYRRTYNMTIARDYYLQRTMHGKWMEENDPTGSRTFMGGQAFPDAGGFEWDGMVHMEIIHRAPKTDDFRNVYTKAHLEDVFGRADGKIYKKQGWAFKLICHECMV